MGEFFQMGGYGGYVWPAYGVSALGLGVIIFLVRRRLKTTRARLEALQRKKSQEKDA